MLSLFVTWRFHLKEITLFPPLIVTLCVFLSVRPRIIKCQQRIVTLIVTLTVFRFVKITTILVTFSIVTLWFLLISRNFQFAWIPLWSPLLMFVRTTQLSVCAILIFLCYCMKRWPLLACLIDLFSFVCLLSHFRPRDVTLENYLFQIQANSRGNE